MKYLLVLLSTLLLLIFSTVACNGDSTLSSPSVPLDSPNAIPVLDGTTWVLSTMNGISVDDTCLFELCFFDNDGDYMESHNCCNNCSANYVIGSKHFSLIEESFRSDPWYCESYNVPVNLVQQENDYFNTLLSISSYQYQGEMLEFEDSNGETVLSFMLKENSKIDPALQVTQWELTSLNGIKPEANITMRIEDYRISGFGGVNGYGGEVSVANNGMLKLYRPLMATHTGNFGNRGKQESQYFQMLQGSDTYAITDKRLEIHTIMDEMLEFKAVEEGK